MPIESYAAHRIGLGRGAAVSDDTALRVEGVSMVFDNGFQALDDVSVVAERGQFVTLLGPSGCGKTTLLRLIGGFLEPTAGQIWLEGEDVTKLPPEKRDTTMVFQSYALFPHMTVGDNVEFGLRQKKLPRAERRERVEEALAYVSLQSQRSKRPEALSGGQQQRVALARALATRAGVVLYDEPLSNLDAKLREQVRFELRKLQRDHGFTAIYVTHDQAEALAMSDVIYVMNGGRIVQEGHPEEIYDKPRNRFVADFLGVANIASGTVKGPEGDGHRIRCEFGEIMVTGDEGDPPEQVEVSWRPEDSVVVDEGFKGPNVFELKVIETVFLGNLTDIIGEVTGKPGQQFRVQVLRHAHGDLGSVIHVYIAPDRFRILESDTS